MQEYRAYFVGPDGHVQLRVDLSAQTMTRLKNGLRPWLMVTTLNCGGWAARSQSSKRSIKGRLTYGSWGSGKPSF